jgi:hypothetical protein
MTGDGGTAKEGATGPVSFFKPINQLLHHRCRSSVWLLIKKLASNSSLFLYLKISERVTRNSDGTSPKKKNKNKRQRKITEKRNK